MERKKIGELALTKNWLTESELNYFLTLQHQSREAGQPLETTFLGQLFIEQGICSPAMVQNLLNEQNNSTEFQFQLLEKGGKSFPFGNYVIENFVAKGGMGAVYKAKDPAGSWVAIKIIRWTHSDEKLKKRFLRENKILAKLKHEHIVNTYEYGEINGVHFLVMDYLEGETLDQAIQTQKLTYTKWLEKFLTLLEAIDFIHKSNIVHRDLKPSNIMMTTQGKLVLIDFGLGKIMREEGESSLLTTQIMGSLPYMAPEQTITEGEHDFRTDIWALGVILYEMLTQKRPFKSKKNRKLIFNIQYKKQKSILEHKSNLPWQLDAICNCALQKKKEDRYQSIAEMKKDIKRFMNGDEIFVARSKILQIFRYRFNAILLGYFFSILSITPILLIPLHSEYFTIVLIMGLSISLTLLLWFYWKQGYRLILDDRGISEQTRFSTKPICQWEDIFHVTTMAQSGKIAIETEMKLWTSPKIKHLYPQNLLPLIRTHLKNDQRDLEIIKILLQGGNIEDVAEKLEMDSKIAQQITQKTAERLQSALWKFFKYEE